MRAFSSFDHLRRRPAPAISSNRRTAPGAAVDAAFKLTLKLNVKTIAHGPALRHQLSPADRWEGRPAYKLSECAKTLSAKAWQTVHWREGTKGALVSRFAALRV